MKGEGEGYIREGRKGERKGGRRRGLRNGNLLLHEAEGLDSPALETAA